MNPGFVLRSLVGAAVLAGATSVAPARADGSFDIPAGAHFNPQKLERITEFFRKEVADGKIPGAIVLATPHSDRFSLLTAGLGAREWRLLGALALEHGLSRAVLLALAGEGADAFGRGLLRQLLRGDQVIIPTFVQPLTWQHFLTEIEGGDRVVPPASVRPPRVPLCFRDDSLHYLIRLWDVADQRGRLPGDHSGYIEIATVPRCCVIASNLLRCGFQFVFAP